MLGVASTSVTDIASEINASLIEAMMLGNPVNPDSGRVLPDKRDVS